MAKLSKQSFKHMLISWMGTIFLIYHMYTCYTQVIFWLHGLYQVVQRPYNHDLDDRLMKLKWLHDIPFRWSGPSSGPPEDPQQRMSEIGLIHMVYTLVVDDSVLFVYHISHIWHCIKKFTGQLQFCSISGEMEVTQMIIFSIGLGDKGIMIIWVL